MRGQEQATVDLPDVVNPVYSHVPASAATPSNAPDATAEQLLALFIDRHTAMDYTAAAETALRLIQVAPHRPHGYYNLACALARLRRLDESLTALGQAIDNGWRDARHLAIDPDLANLRSLAAFDAITHRLATVNAAERLEAAPLREDSWAIVREDLAQHAPALLSRFHVPLASVAVIQNGRVAGTMNLYAEGATPARQSIDKEPLVFRVRKPVEVLGLVAGAQLQQRGQLMLAELFEQGAALDRETKSRGNQNADRRDQPVVITPAARNQTRDGEQRSSRAAMRIDPNNATFSLLRLSIELASGGDFSAYCTRNILEPLAMNNSGFSRQIRDSGQVQPTTGQTVLGTAVSLKDIHDGPTSASVLYATAGDLARLIEYMLTSERAAEDSALDMGLQPDPIAILARVNAIAPGGVGLGVQVRQFETGRRVQVLEVGEGVGCLMRWHPRKGSGIVVLFNSESGGEAALRLAHIALGGE